jgi:predicted kinase
VRSSDERPTLYVMVGLPAVGKTHRAKEIEATTGALRLTPDEWMLPILEKLENEPKRDVVEGRLIWVAARVLRLGVSVILDFGLWSRDERTALRHLAADAGAGFELVYVDVDDDVQRRQRDHRETVTPQRTVPLNDRKLEEYRTRFETPTPDELAGIDHGPPAGHESWLGWIAVRWPTSID